VSVLRNRKPPERPLRDFHLPEVKKFKLGNGLKITFVEKKNLPIVQMALLLDAGSRRDEKGKEGTAYALTLLIDEGAGKYDALKLDDEFEKRGSIFSISANVDTFNISLLSLREHFEKSLEIFSAVLKNPHLKKKDFEREKKKQMTKILELKDKPSYIANVLFDKYLFSPTPYAVPTIGFKESVENIELSDVRTFYESFFSPYSAELIVVGNISMKELKELLIKYLEDWEGKNVKPFGKSAPRPSKRKIIFYDKPGAAQSELRLGHLTDRRNLPDYFPKLIANAILGGHFGSRLNSNLREAKGFTYGINSSFDYNRIGGSFLISTSVETKNTIAAVEEILKETLRFREGITDEELEFAKSFLTKRFPLYFETYGQIASNLASLILFDLPDTFFDTYITDVMSVGKEEVLRTIKEKIRPNDFILVIVGDRQKLEKDLEKCSHFEGIEIVEGK